MEPMTVNARPRHMLKPVIVVIAAAGVLLLGGCSSHSSTLSSASSAGGAADFAGKSANSANGVSGTTLTDTLSARVPAAAPSKAQAKGESDSDVLGRKVISTGKISLETKDVAATRKKVLALVAGWKGEVSNEQATSSRSGTMEFTHLVLRVPSNTFDAAMAGLAAAAHATSQQRTAQDVTTKVIDTNARVQAKKRAVQQLERLLDRATTLGEVIRLEGDISDRQAELESLQQQQRYLHDQTSMSTITLDIDHTPGTHHKKTHTTGILAGLEGGWHALGAVVTGLLTALGAVLPFAVVLAVVALPVWWVRRRRAGTA